MTVLRTLPLFFAATVAAAIPGSAEASGIGEPKPSLVPPRPIALEPAPWPERATGAATSVGLVLTIDEAGNVTSAEVVEPAGGPFDDLAREACLRFRFEPATRDGVPLAARVRYRHAFEPPPEPIPPPEPSPESDPSPEPKPADEELEVTVRGRSDAERRRESAEAVVFIDTAEAKHRSADLGEVLARQEGVEVRRAGGLGSGTRFSLNGLSDDQVRFFLDGVPLELVGFPYGIANVPVQLVEGIEVYRGVVPIRFGADALGGAVNLVTDTRPRGNGVVASLQGGAFGTWRLAAAGHHHDEGTGFLARAHLFADRSDNDYAIEVEAADRDTGKMSPATVERFHDAYAAIGAGLDLGFVDLEWADRIALRVHGSGFDKELQNALVMTPSSVPFGEATWSASGWGGQLLYERAFSRTIRLDAVAGYGRQRTRLRDDGDRVWDWFGPTGATRTTGELSERKRDEITEQDAVYGRFALSWDFADDQSLRLAVSPTGIHRTADDRLLADGDAAAALARGRTQVAWISGVEYEIDLFDDRLETIVFAKDYRYQAEGWRALARGGVEQVEQRLTRTGWGAATRLRLSRTTQLKASFELATRLPSPDELFGDGGLVEPNLELSPETSRNANLGVDARDVHTPVGRLRGGINGFARVVEDFILLQQTGLQSSAYRNVGEGTALGVEVAAGWSAPGDLFHVDGNLTWQDFRNTSTDGPFAAYEGDRMVYRPWLFGNVSARLELRDTLRERDRLSPFWSARYVHDFLLGWESLGDPSTKNAIPAQFVQAAGVSYRFTVGSASLGVTIEVDNLADEKTFDFFGVQRPGRAGYLVTTLEY